MFDRFEEENNYDCLEEYIKNVKCCFEAYTATAKLTKKEYNVNFQEIFRFLVDYTLMKLSKLDIENIDEIKKSYYKNLDEKFNKLQQ